VRVDSTQSHHALADQRRGESGEDLDQIGLAAGAALPPPRPALFSTVVLGAIAIGKEGTLIALEGNPLTDITAVQRVRAVVKTGQVVKHPAPAAR